MTIYCIDASALVLYVTSQTNNTDLSSALKNIEQERAEGIMSTVTIAEFHRGITRISSEDNADKFVAWIQESPIRIIPITLEIALLASVKKQSYAKVKQPFAWGDAFCLATGLIHHADVLITSDKEFDNVNEISIMKV